MPDAFPKPCIICQRTLVVGRARCSHCERVRTRRYASASARGYGRKWRTARAAYLQKYPFCRTCLSAGREVRATELDHIRPHHGDDQLFWLSKNWQPLCKPCHARKTLAETKEKYADA